MSNKITKDDLNLKSFFEQAMGYTITRASFAHGTLVYYMTTGSKDIRFEQKADTSMSITICGVTRTIPAEPMLEKALGHKPSRLEICRIVQEVLLKMIHDQLDETRKQVTGDFERFSRRGH